MRTLFTVFFLTTCTTALFASDIYLVQGFAVGPQIDAGTAVLWTTSALFYNTGSATATIRLVNVSNRGGHPLPDNPVLPPQRSASLDVIGTTWNVSPEPLWVVHLDVPPEVLIEAALFIGTSSAFGSPSSFPYVYGKVRLPVFRSLIPGGQKQIHLLTSLGPASNIPIQVQVPSRINVAIYNSASVPANAVIEIRQHCDDQVVATRTVVIPADTILQIGPFDARTNNCQSNAFGDGGRFVYTTVTVDQPSFSFVSNLSNAATPTTSISITAEP
jgi:hypothetical protein